MLIMVGKSRSGFANDRRAYGCGRCYNLTPITPITPITTILVYNTSQGFSFVWSGVTFTINTNLPNYSYTSITSYIPSTIVPGGSYLISVTIGNSVTSIGNDAFNGCNNLSSVTIGNSVTSIGNSAFRECSVLTITIPNSVTIIDDYAFYSCLNLTSVTIGNSVTIIGYRVFQYCYNLSNVIFTPSSTLESIGSRAFLGCSALSYITIPNSVTSIGVNAFFTCGVTNVYISNNTAVYLGNIISKSWVSPGTVSTPDFYNAPNLVNFIVPT